jgi:hypothetical protein
MINLVLKSYKIKQQGMTLEKNSIKKINETKRNYNEKNGAQLFFFIKKSGMKLKRKSIRRRVKNKININGKKENQIQHQNKIKYNDKE